MPIKIPVTDHDDKTNLNQNARRLRILGFVDYIKEIELFFNILEEDEILEFQNEIDQLQQQINKLNLTK